MPSPAGAVAAAAIVLLLLVGAGPAVLRPSTVAPVGSASGAVPGMHPDLLARPMVATTPDRTMSFIESGLPNGLTWSVTINGTTSGAISSTVVNSTLTAVLYDPFNDLVYVAISGADQVSILNATNGSLMATLPVGSDPTALALDPTDGYLYVANTGSNNISVLDGESEVTSIPVGTAPSGVAVAPANDTVYVSNAGTTGRSNVTVINGSLLLPVGSIRVGADPRGLTYDPRNTLLYVANFGSGNLTVINTTLNRTVHWIPIGSGSEPWAPAFDSANGELLVAGAGGSVPGVLVLDPATDATVATIPIGGGLTAPLYDARNGDLYLGRTTSAQAIVLNVSTESELGTIPLRAPVGETTVNTTSGFLFLSTPGADRVTLVNGSFTAGGAAMVESPRAFSNTTENGAGVITVTDPAGRYSYSALAPSPYLTANGTGVLDTELSAATLPIPFGKSHPVTFTETGLPNGEPWTVGVTAVVSDGVLGTNPLPAVPGSVLFDPLDYRLYVAEPSAARVLVIDVSDNATVASIGVGADPAALAVDSATGEIYVANAGANNVSVIDPSENAVVRTIPVGTAPEGVAIAPVNDTVMVANAGSANVTEIDGATGLPFGSISVGADPVAIVYDGGNQLAYVTVRGSPSLAVIDPAKGTLAATIPLPTIAQPNGTAVDSQSGALYVASDDASGTVYVVSPTSRSVTTSIRTGTPLGAPVYSPFNDYVYAAEPTRGRIVVLNTSTETVAGVEPAVASPGAIALDATDALLFAANAVPTELIELNAAGATGGVERLGVTDYRSDTTSGGTGVIDFSVLNGNYTFSVLPPAYYTVAPTGGVVAVVGAGVNESIAFTPVPYSVITFVETSGLPAGHTWTVEFNGTSVTTEFNSAQFRVPAGTYPYIVIGPKGREVSGIPASGSITASGSGGSGPTELFSFVKGPTYSLVFRESGLPSGRSWCVETVATTCTTKGSIALHGLTSASYPYAVGSIRSQTLAVTLAGHPVGSSGTAVIAGRGATFRVRFTYPYPVMFAESGLATGTVWSVRIAGLTYTSTVSTLVVGLANGTHAFAVGKVSGYTRTPGPSRLDIVGAGATVTLAFHPDRGGSPAAPTTAAALRGPGGSVPRRTTVGATAEPVARRR